MSNIIYDWKALKTPILNFFLVSFMIFNVMMATNKIPASLVLLNEMFMIPFVIVATVMFFQREFGGYFSEILATMPVTFSYMILRKLSQLLLFVIIIHMTWVIVFRLCIGELESVVLSYTGGISYFGKITWLKLFAQSLPAYLLLSMITLSGMVYTKKIYVGLAAGFSWWLFESISQGSITQSWTIYYILLPEDTEFITNRLALLGASIILLAFNIYWASKRERWIVDDE